MVFPEKEPLSNRAPIVPIIPHLTVKINKNIIKNKKLVVQYHGRLLMSCCSVALVHERTLAGEGIQEQLFKRRHEKELLL